MQLFADPPDRDTPADDAVRRCSTPGCGRAARARGLCGAHYGRWVTRGDVDMHLPVRGLERRAGTCRVPTPAGTCGREVRCRGLCGAHYGRMVRFGDVLAHVPYGRRAADYGPAPTPVTRGASQPPLPWLGDPMQLELPLASLGG